MKKLVFLALIFAGLAVGHPAHADGRWSGFYFGGNAGYAWGSADSTLSIADGAGATCHFCDVTLGGADAALAQSAGSPGLSPSGFTGGVQLGFNAQHASWVYGVEIDFEAFSQKETVSSSFGMPTNTANFNCFSGGVVPCVGNFSTSVKTNWLLTIRPRIGYAWQDMLVYFTAGLAFTKIKYEQSYNDNINFFTASGGSVATSASQTKTGWTVGGGLARSFGDNWSMHAEYLYVRFEDVTASGVLTDGGGFVATFTNNLDHLSSHIVRVGINYTFGAPPIVTKY